MEIPNKVPEHSKEPKTPAPASRGSDTLEITYSEGQRSTQAKKAIKQATIRQNPETLFADFTSKEEDKRKTNVLFYTDQPSAWHIALCQHYKNISKCGINKGRQIRIKDTEHEEVITLTINLYNNGTVVIQGPEENLEKFEQIFLHIKVKAQTHKEQTAETKVSDDPPCTETLPRGPPAPCHPSPETMRDCLSQLERDFVQFKEEYQRNLGAKNTNEQFIKEINKLRGEYTSGLQEMGAALQDIQQENTRLKQEIEKLKTRQEGSSGKMWGADMTTGSDQDNDISNNPSTMAPDTKENQVETGPTTNHTPGTEPNQRPTRPDSNQDTTHQVTGSNRDTRHQVTGSNRDTRHRVTGSNQDTTHQVTSSNRDTNTRHQTTRKSQRPDVVCIIDSNGKYLNTRRLFPRKTVSKIRCATIEQATAVINNPYFSNPNHIIIHTGTNNLQDQQHQIAEQLTQLARSTRQAFPGCKIIISSLLPRKDIANHITQTINTELAAQISPMPDITLAQHSAITHHHLYDNKHLNKQGVSLLAKELKDIVLNRNPRPEPYTGQRQNAMERPPNIRRRQTTYLSHQTGNKVTFPKPGDQTQKPWRKPRTSQREVSSRDMEEIKTLLSTLWKKLM